LLDFWQDRLAFDKPESFCYDFPVVVEKWPFLRVLEW